jgi:hypothetical protein
MVKRAKRSEVESELRAFEKHLANKRPFVSDMNKPILWHFMDSHYEKMRREYDVENLFKEPEYNSTPTPRLLSEKAPSPKPINPQAPKPPRYKCSLPFVQDRSQLPLQTQTMWTLNTPSPLGHFQ